MIKTATELMQSRYQAYINKDSHYLLSSWAPQTKPKTVDCSNQPQWIGLKILSQDKGRETDTTGKVHFKAFYIDGDKINCLEESSNFIRVDQQWLYVDGDIIPNKAWLPKRNELCPCQSGKKFKRCCCSKITI